MVIKWEKNRVQNANLYLKWEGEGIKEFYFFRIQGRERDFFFFLAIFVVRFSFLLTFLMWLYKGLLLQMKSGECRIDLDILVTVSFSANLCHIAN